MEQKNLKWGERKRRGKRKKNKRERNKQRDTGEGGGVTVSAIFTREGVVF